MKATYVEVNKPKFEGDFNPEGREIFKDPITDDGTKKSATGLLCVKEDHEGNYSLLDKVTWQGEDTGKLQKIYQDGSFYNQVTLDEIRKELDKSIVNQFQLV